MLIFSWNIHGTLPIRGQNIIETQQCLNIYNHIIITIIAIRGGSRIFQTGGGGVIFFLFFHAVPGPRQHFFLYTKLPLSLVHSVGKLFLLNRSFKQRKQINRNKLPPGMCREKFHGSAYRKQITWRLRKQWILSLRQAYSTDERGFFCFYARVGIFHVTARLQGTETQ